MAKKRSKRIFNNEETAEDWCFECKDGGELMRWHSCLICCRSSNFHCYCCKRAAFSRHIGLIDFVHHKGDYGFCNNCLKLALLVEEDRNVDSDGAQLNKEKICRTSSNSGKHSEEEDEQLSSDTGDFIKSKKIVFVGWGSKALIHFLQFIGQDTREKLSQRDVALLVTKYIKDHNLIHPDEKRRILCDVRLRAVFQKDVVNKRNMFHLLERHFVDNEEHLQKDELDHDREDDDTETLVAAKTEEKVEQNKTSSIWFSTAPHSQFAALISENIKLVYLKKSLLMEMIKQPESIETKIIGSFVRVKLDPCDNGKHNSHQLVQVTEIKHGSSDSCNSENKIQVSNMAEDVCLTMLSDGEITKEECDELNEKVKAGLLRKFTIVELEHKARILHEDITELRIVQELQLFQCRIDHANEKGWRDLYPFFVSFPFCG
ncbi:unnamed protein product [Withania somnifera]